MIPPIYIFVTVAFPDTKSRAKYFGIVSGAAGLGAPAGPLIGGLVTSAINWRASFVLQVLVVAISSSWHGRSTTRRAQRAAPRFDLTGAILSAAGLFFVVLGILQSAEFGWFSSREGFHHRRHGGHPARAAISPVWLFVGIGALFLLWFFLHIRPREEGQGPLVATRLFHNRISNLGLDHQNIQWLIMQGSFFVISVFLQQVRGYSAIETGLILTPTTIGHPAGSGAARSGWPGGARSAC